VDSSKSYQIKMYDTFEQLTLRARIISETTIKGKYMRRVCNVNHRSKYSDFNILVERIKSIGDILVKEYH